MQESLGRLGLSSLGRLEGHVLVSLLAVIRALTRLSGRRWRDNPLVAKVPVNFTDGAYNLLQIRADELLGATERRAVRIMVTMPSEAATNYELVYDLVAAGMDIMRINCAHDSLEQWQDLIENLSRSEMALGKKCRVYADLPGPKMRTWSLQPVGRILTLGVRHNERGGDDRAGTYVVAGRRRSRTAVS